LLSSQKVECNPKRAIIRFYSSKFSSPSSSLGSHFQPFCEDARFLPHISHWQPCSTLIVFLPRKKTSYLIDFTDGSFFALVIQQNEQFIARVMVKRALYIGNEKSVKRDLATEAGWRSNVGLWFLVLVDSSLTLPHSGLGSTISTNLFRSKWPTAAPVYPLFSD